MTGLIVRRSTRDEKQKQKQESGKKKEKSKQLITLCGIFWSAEGKTKRSFFSIQRRRDAEARQTKTDGQDRPSRRDTAPRSADRWTMTRRSMKPAERAPCFPFSLMSGGSVLPATIRSFTAAPPPCSRLCRTPITHQQPASACVTLQVRASGVGFQNKVELQGDLT